MARIAQVFEEQPEARAALQMTAWRGGPERLVDELSKLSPVGALALARQADAGLTRLEDLEALSDPDLVLTAAEMLV